MTKHFFINEGCHSSMKKQQINCFIKAYVSTWNIIIFKTLLSTRHYVQTRNRCENLDLAGRNVIFGIIVNTFKFSSRNTLVYLSSRHLALACKPVLCFFFFFCLFGFTPFKVEQPLRGMELQEKKARKDYSIQEICLERTYS